MMRDMLMPFFRLQGNSTRDRGFKRDGATRLVTKLIGRRVISDVLNDAVFPTDNELGHLQIWQGIAIRGIYHKII